MVQDKRTVAGGIYPEKDSRVASDDGLATGLRLVV